MPTVVEMKIYAERRRVPEEIKAKVDSCRTEIYGIEMAEPFGDQEYLTDSECVDGMHYPSESILSELAA